MGVVGDVGGDACWLDHNVVIVSTLNNILADEDCVCFLGGGWKGRAWGVGKEA